MGGNIAINKLLSSTDNLKSPLSGRGSFFPKFIPQNKVDALLELREQEIMNIDQSNPRRYCRLQVFPRRRPDIPQCSRKELSNYHLEKSLGHFSATQNL